VSDGLRLILIRHGVTDWNNEGRFQGHLDPPLSTVGRRQAAYVAERIGADRDLRPDRIISSTLARAAGTAAVIGARCGLPPETDARLIELGQGEWEGRTHAELARDDPERYTAWLTSDREPPGAETVTAGLERVAATLDAVSGAAATICLVSHGGTLRLVARHLLGLEAGRAWGMDLDNASISVLESLDDDRWRLLRWNDTGHLLGRGPTHVDEAEGHPLAL
jgi:broad specificity phosphatase PhoE